MRIVVKIGSSSLVEQDGQVRRSTIDTLTQDIADAMKAGAQVVLVSSGAIATGLGVLGRASRPTLLPELQAASAVGQRALLEQWAESFAVHGLTCGQVLLTMHDVSQRSSYVNARSTLVQLLDWGIVPVVNENDTTATDEITFGDNDTLAAQVAVSLSMDRLVLLTDTDGLYTEHPSSPAAELIRDVHDHSLLRRIDTATPGSHWGSGGMRSKVIAAEMASFGGTVTHIARAGEAGVLSRVMNGQPCGTRVDADGRGHSSFKLWLRYAKPATGVLLVDDGAVAALAERGASLLPIGIVGVEGSFSAGDAVEVKRASDGHVIAKGLVDHSAREVARFVADRERARGQDEAIHRDRLVLIGMGPDPTA